MSLVDAIESLRAYADHGRPTGGFLEAVLSNDLMEAIERADESSLANLRAICSFVYNDLPMTCHGSREAVDAWLQRHAERRANEAANAS